jgi:hypothetical protein
MSLSTMRTYGLLTSRGPRGGCTCRKDNPGDTCRHVETGNFSGVGYGLLVPVGQLPPPSIEEAAVATTAAVDWKIAIDGTDAFGEVCRHEIWVDKSWDRLFDGDIGLSVDDG